MNTDTNSENQTVEQPIEEQVIPEIVEESISPLEKLETELAEMKDKFLRLNAEFDNFRRRTSKEKIELISTAEERLMLALLPVADDVDRAKIAFEKTDDSAILKEGIELIFNKLAKILESKGLKSMNSKGEVFNPDLHEAITQIPAPTEELKGKIVDEIEKGYYLNDKMIRVSKVIIGQ